MHPGDQDVRFFGIGAAEFYYNSYCLFSFFGMFIHWSNGKLYSLNSNLAILYLMPYYTKVYCLINHTFTYKCGVIQPEYSSC
jgi:hypothetical protein